MKFLFFIFLFAARLVTAKVPPQAELYSCQFGRPLFLHVTQDGTIIGLCGINGNDKKKNYTEFSVHTFTNKQKDSPAIFTNQAADKVFLPVERADGLTLVEKIKVGKVFLEIFKNDIQCAKGHCVKQPEVCLVSKKAKFKLIAKQINDEAVKERLKNAGCL